MFECEPFRQLKRADCGPSSRPTPAMLSWRLNCFVIAILTLERHHTLAKVQQECCGSPGWIPPSESLTLQLSLQPPSSSRPDKLWCPPHPRPFMGGERHPLTSSSIIRDGREPLWVLSNSIQEFSQPVQSSLDKLTPCPPPPTPTPERTRCGLSAVSCPTIPWCNPDTRLSSSTGAQRKVRREERSS